MNLLEFSIQSQKYLNTLTGKEYALECIRLHEESFFKYHWYKYTIKRNKKEEEITDYLVCISLGLEYFNTIIKYWDNPDKYLEDIKKDKEKDKEKEEEADDTYNKNFVEMLKNNKNR